MAPSMGFEFRVASVCFSPDGKLFARASDGVVCLWNVSTGRKAERFDRSVHSISFSPDGALLACGTRDGTVCLLDAATERRLFGDIASEGSEGPVESISFSARGIHVVRENGFRTSITTYGLSALPRPALPFAGAEGHVHSHHDQRLQRGVGIVQSHFTIVPLFGIDISGLDFTMARIDERPREILRYNGAKT